MIKQTKFRTGVLIMMIVLAALSRLLPHPDNVTPVGAMALFGGAYFSRKYLALIIPILAMWFSDLVLNNTLYAHYYDGFVWMGNTWVYASLIAISLIGMALLKKVKVKNVVLASVIGSILFFLVTNFGVWAGPHSMFPKTSAGLISTYAAGLPFFRASLLGDLVYCGVLFGGFEWAKSNWSALRSPVHA